MSTLDSAADLKSWEDYKAFLKDQLKLLPDGGGPIFVSKEKLDFDVAGKPWSGYAVLAGPKAAMVVAKLRKEGVLFREGLCRRQGKDLQVEGIPSKLAKEANKTLVKSMLGYSATPTGAEVPEEEAGAAAAAGAAPVAGDLASAWEKLKGELVPRIQQAVQTAPKVRGEIQKLVSQATTQAKSGDFAGAIQSFKAAGALLSGGGTPPTGPAAGSGAAAPTPGAAGSAQPPVEEATSPTSKIGASVGKGGKNEAADVLRVQQLLGKFGFKLEQNGKSDKDTEAAIESFQKKYLGSEKPDGRIDAGGKTWDALLGIGRIQGELDALAKQFGVETAVLLAIQSIESGGNGYLGDGRPKILFEGHVFWKQLKAAGKDPAKLATGNEDVLYPSWDKTKYKGGAAEYTRLDRAKAIDETTALKSASWGEFQIMGFNHSSAGYSDVNSMVEAMKRPGGGQLKAVLEFIKTNDLLKHVKGDKKDWAAFAKGYNGPGYKDNKYDTKLEAAYDRFKKIEAS